MQFFEYQPNVSLFICKTVWQKFNRGSKSTSFISCTGVNLKGLILFLHNTLYTDDWDMLSCAATFRCEVHGSSPNASTISACFSSESRLLLPGPPECFFGSIEWFSQGVLSYHMFHWMLFVLLRNHQTRLNMIQHHLFIYSLYRSSDLFVNDLKSG